MKTYMMIFIAMMVFCFAVMAQDTPQSRLNARVASAKAAVTHVTPESLLIKMATDTNFVLIDIREGNEYEAGHISGAIHIPCGVLDWRIANVIESTDHDVVLYCRSGGRSALAAQSLMELGYTGITDLKGGIKGWVAADYSLYNFQGEIKIINFGAKDPRLSE